MNRINSSGPKFDPCCTPETSLKDNRDIGPSNLTKKTSSRSDKSQSKPQDLLHYQTPATFAEISCGTLSDAF